MPTSLGWLSPDAWIFWPGPTPAPASAQPQPQPLSLTLPQTNPQAPALPACLTCSHLCCHRGITTASATHKAARQEKQMCLLRVPPFLSLCPVAGASAAEKAEGQRRWSSRHFLPPGKPNAAVQHTCTHALCAICYPYRCSAAERASVCLPKSPSPLECRCSRRGRRRSLPDDSVRWLSLGSRMCHFACACHPALTVQVQQAWEEAFPFADKKALKAARLVGLKEHPQVGRWRLCL